MKMKIQMVGCSIRNLTQTHLVNLAEDYYQNDYPDTESDLDFEDRELFLHMNSLVLILFHSF